jgi:hypothetical protein
VEKIRDLLVNRMRVGSLSVEFFGWGSFFMLRKYASATGLTAPHLVTIQAFIALFVSSSDGGVKIGVIEPIGLLVLR